MQTPDMEGDYDTMTDSLEAALVLSGKPSVATGLQACRLPVWLHDCICGNEIIQLRATRAEEGPYDGY